MIAVYLGFVKNENKPKEEKQENEDFINMVMNDGLPDIKQGPRQKPRMIK